jgi:hypothetical protein
MTKKVNIYPKYPITSVTPAIRTVSLGITKPVEDIRKCIIARAIVDEVLSDGTTVRLNMNNFNKNNDKSKVEKAVEAVKTSESITEEVKPEITEQEGIVVDEEPAAEEEVVEEPVEEKPTYQQNNNYNNNKHNKKNKNNKFNNNNNQQNNKSEDNNEDK